MQPEVIECIFTNNRAIRGGAIPTFKSSMHVKDSTFNGNVAEDYGGVALLENGTLVVSNSDNSSKWISRSTGSIYNKHNTATSIGALIYTRNSTFNILVSGGCRIS